MIGHVLSQSCIHLACLFSSSMYQKSTSGIARKREKTLIGTTIEKPGHWMCCNIEMCGIPLKALTDLHAHPENGEPRALRF